MQHTFPQASLLGPFLLTDSYSRLLWSLKAKIRQLSYCLFPLYSLQWHPSLHDFIDYCQENSSGPLLVCLCKRPRRSIWSHQALDVAITPAEHIYSQSSAFFVHSLTASPHPRAKFDRQSSDPLRGLLRVRGRACLYLSAPNFMYPWLRELQ